MESISKTWQLKMRVYIKNNIVKTHRKLQIHQIDIFLSRYIEKYQIACTGQYNICSNQKIRLIKHQFKSYEYFSVAMETKTKIIFMDSQNLKFYLSDDIGVCIYKNYSEST